MERDADLADSVARLAAILQSSKQFPFAAKAGELLAKRFPATSVDAPANIDALLAKLQQRYHTPIPEAYLSEAVTKQLGQRRQQGAFYTPWPLAKYLLRSASELVEKEFPGTIPTYLDPASGAGIFCLANESAFPDARFRSWDSSIVAVELAKAIFESRGLAQRAHTTFEHRDALLIEPEDERPLENTQPLLIVGNPPYSNFGKRSLSGWLARELQVYRPSHVERKTNLRDAFLLFLRLAESLIVRQGQGGIAMVLSTTFLDAITHREVRASLRRSFDELHVLRLQSEINREDENLFSIRQPTAACVFVRRSGASSDRAGRVWHSELTGARDEKLTWLDHNSLATTRWAEIASSDLEAEQGRGGWGGKSSTPHWYSTATGLNAIFREYISGVQTKNDSLFLARTRNELEKRIRSHFGQFDEFLVQPILVAPFDPWWIYYDPKLLGRARYSVMRHMLRENLGLVFMRQATGAGEYDHFLVTRHMVTDRVLHSRWGAPFLAPLHTWNDERKASNVAEDVPQDWLAFTYALAHSHWYRSRAGEGLRRDFPRIPSSSFFSKSTRSALTALGIRLIELQAPKGGFRAFQQSDEASASMIMTARLPKAEPYGDEVQIYVNRDQCLGTISKRAWEYRIGGVEVLRRILMRRRGTTLFAWEADHFLDVARRLEETIELRKRIDAIPLAEAECNASPSGES